MSYPTASLTKLLHDSRTARTSRPALATAGRFDRRAIMAEAVRIARSIGVPGWTWAKRMRAGLLQAWKRAREAMAASPVAVQPPPVRVRLFNHTGRTRVFLRGSRAFSHG